jgi:hypothetical protein
MLNFTSFNEDAEKRFSHAQFRGIVRKALGRLPAWAHGCYLDSFTFDGDAVENNWKENPKGESYRSRVGEARRPDLQEWADGVLSPAIARINERYARDYGWGVAKLSTGRGASGPDAAGDRRNRRRWGKKDFGDRYNPKA